MIFNAPYGAAPIRQFTEIWIGLLLCSEDEIFHPYSKPCCFRSDEHNVSV